MAGINLSGAIGMGGKRESVYSDVPSIIQNTGDFIAKARLEAQEQKAKLAAAQKEKDLEDRYKQQQALSVVIKEGNDLSVFKPQFDKFAEKKALEAQSIYDNPQIPKSVKVSENARILREIDTAANYLKNNETAFRESQKDKENPIYDTSEQQAVLAGVYGIDYMKPQAPDNTNAAYDVPTPEQQAPIPQIEVRKPVHQMTYEEQVQEHPRGLGYSLSDKKRLVNVTPDAAIDYTLPKITWDSILDSNKSIQEHKTYNKNYNLQRATWVDAVVSGKNDKTKVIKAGLEATAINLINSKHQDFNTQQKEKFINDFVFDQAGEMFDNRAGLEIDAQVRDKEKQASNSGRGTTTPANAPIEREVPANQDRVDEIKDKISEHQKVLDNYKTINKDALTEARKTYNNPNIDKSSKEYQDARAEIKEYQKALQNKAALDAQLKTELAKKVKVKDLNIKDENVNFSIDGTNMVVDATGYRRDSEGNVFVYVNSPKSGEKNVFEKKVIPYTTDMATELKPETINLLRKNGYIDENNEPIKTKKSVSSQPKESAKPQPNKSKKKANTYGI